MDVVVEEDRSVGEAAVVVRVRTALTSSMLKTVLGRTKVQGTTAPDSKPGFWRCRCPCGVVAKE